MTKSMKRSARHFVSFPSLIMKWPPGVGAAALTVFFLIFPVFLALCACAPRQVYAPVVDATFQSIPVSGVHHVRQGETLYSIAFRYGLDVRVLAARNHLATPWRIRQGQVLFLRTPAQGAARGDQPARISAQVPTIHRKSHPRAVSGRGMLHRAASGGEGPRERFHAGHWRWPAKGALAGSYSPASRGINIAGRLGQPVVATAAGEVVYAGDGLRGYGNLVIIRHGDLWLSAYAWNSELAVRQGQWVRAGQRIATMGRMRGFRPMLHFEIRRAGRPVNPLQILAAQG